MDILLFTDYLMLAKLMVQTKNQI